MDRHVNDSLSLLPALDTRIEALSPEEAPRLVDVGSGAGFPGVVLAIARPNWQARGTRAAGRQKSHKQFICRQCGAVQSSHTVVEAGLSLLFTPAPRGQKRRHKSAPMRQRPGGAAGLAAQAL